MKKYFSLIIPALFILFSASCKKDKPAQTVHSDKVKSYTETLNLSSGTTTETYNFEYDNQDRITTITTSSNPVKKFVYTYDVSGNFSLDSYSENTLFVHENFFVKDSLVDSTYQYDNTLDTITEKYVYNSSNLLSVLDEYAYYYGLPVLSRITVYTYDNDGNLIKTANTNNKVETFDYYPDLVYALPVLSPKTKKKKSNLIKTYTLQENGFTIGTTTSTYTFDDNNRITSITETASNGDLGTKTFTYFD
jgi:YD repeat-containing protein